MRCLVLGCEQDARGEVDSHDRDGVWIPAHYCRYCWHHMCEMEIFLLRRHRR